MKRSSSREKKSREKVYTIKFHITSQISPKHPALFASAPGLFSLPLSLSLSFVVVYNNSKSDDELCAGLFFDVFSFVFFFFC